MDVSRDMERRRPRQRYRDMERRRPERGGSGRRMRDLKKIIADFDPSTQRVDVWLNEVNECALVYDWDARTTVLFAMDKLQGLAKSWYESFNSISFNWGEWQRKLMNAFPYHETYVQALEAMVLKKSNFNEPIEVYYYEKLALLNQCNIEGRRAVECIIDGLSDRALRSVALALPYTQPEQLLQFLVNNEQTQQFVKHVRDLHLGTLADSLQR